jgi:hypothetical protein
MPTLIGIDHSFSFPLRYQDEVVPVCGTVWRQG